MNFWEMFLLSQASSALHTIVRRYAGKYFTPEEMEATDVVLDAITALPERIHPAAEPSAPATTADVVRAAKKK